jgi:hypothetical protein
MHIILYTHTTCISRLRFYTLLREMYCAHPFRNIIVIIVWPIFFPGRWKKEKNSYIHNTYTTGTTPTHSSLRGKPGVRRFSPIVRTLAGHRMFPVFAPAHDVPDKTKYADERKKNWGRRMRLNAYPNGPRIVHRPLTSRCVHVPDVL